MMLLTTQILATLFLIILVPAYWKNYGIKNFLWLSDVGLFLTFFALWLHSPLLMSMVIVGILPAELAWNIDYFIRLFTGRSVLHITNYMFDPKKSKFLRGLSLFHVAMPIIWIGYLTDWDYDQRAFYYQTVLTWIIFILTYLFADSKENTNWVFMPKVYHWQRIPGWAWLMFLLIAYPLLLIWPVHLILTNL